MDTHEQQLKYDLLTEKINTERLRQKLLKDQIAIVEQQFLLVRRQREKLK